MTHTIGLLPPLLAGIMKTIGDEFTVIHRSDYDSDAAMAAAHPEIRALVTIGGDVLDKSLVESLPNLGLIACFGAGYDGIDVAHANSRGVTVSNCPNTNNEDVADHAVGMFVALVRDIVGGHQRLLGGEWTERFRGRAHPSIRQLKAGIAGFGAIGQAIARRLPGFGMEPPMWWGPRAKPEITLPRAASLRELAETSDVLFVAARADDTSRNMISADIIEALGPKGYLVNVSRGSTVDEDALIAALKDKRIAGAALDVFQQEPTPPERWRDVPNVVLNPHVAGGGNAAIMGQIRLVFENLHSFFDGQGAKTPVILRRDEA